MADAPTRDGTMITDLYSGALLLTGVGEHLAPDVDAVLDCYTEHTSSSLNTFIKEQLPDGYPATDPNRTGVDLTREGHQLRCGCLRVGENGAKSAGNRLDRK